MKTETKELLDDMIQYVDSRSPQKHLNEAYEAMDQADLAVAVVLILTWPIEIKVELEKPDKLPISDYDKSVLQQLLNNSTELGTFFYLEKEFLLWSKELSADLKKEIMDYVISNYKPRIDVKYNSDD